MDKFSGARLVLFSSLGRKVLPILWPLVHYERAEDLLSEE